MCWSRNNLCRGDLEIRFHFDKRIARVTRQGSSTVNQVNGGARKVVVGLVD